MNIAVDENIPRLTVRFLRDQGEVVFDIRETSGKGATDVLLWQMVQSQQQMLITTDKGFTRYRNEEHHGVLIICLQQPNCLNIHNSIVRALAQFPPEQWKNRLVVVRDAVMSIWNKQS